MKLIVKRIVSFDIFSPSMLSSVSDTSPFFNKEQGLAPEVLDHPFARHIFTRLQTLAHQQASVGVPQIPQLPPPRRHERQRSPSRRDEQDSSSKDLAKALEHLANAGKKRHKGILQEEPDSEDEDFDLPKALEACGMSDLPADWLPSLRRVGRMDKLFQKSLTSKSSRASTFVSDTALDEWIPSWLGATRTPTVKASLTKAWKKSLQDSHDSSAFLSSSMNLWLTHAVLGIINFKDVFLHLLLLLRLIAEKDILYAVKYERHLQVHIQNHIKSSGSRPVSSFLTAIQKEVSIEQDLDLNKRQMVTPPKKPREDKKASRSRTPPKIRPAPKVKASQSAPSKTKTLICFSHDPANSIQCPLGSKCPNEHLNTSEPAMRARFDRAQAAFKGKKASS